MKLSKRSVVVAAIVITMAIPLQSNNAANIVVNCFVFYYSECPACMTKYNTYVKPFYNKYSNNNSIKFIMIDSAIDASLFWETVDALGLNITELKGFPWVVFEYNNQLIVHDERTLVKIDSSFLSILEESGYKTIINDPNNIELAIIFGIKLDLLILAIGMVAGAFVVMSSLTMTYYHKSKPEKLLKRIGQRRLAAIVGLSTISLVCLGYQFLDYLQGGCGCSEGDVVKQLLFRKHHHVTFLNIDIPFSLAGIILMSAIIILTVLLGITPIPVRLMRFQDRNLVFDIKMARLVYYLLISLLIMAFSSLFYLLYLEIVVIRFICVFCTISQVIIVADTALILSWNPFKLELNSGV
ncbi:MAG: hypothetical protein ACTSW1_11630 [Candidatus Hodarchaeales archaeon]